MSFYGLVIAILLGMSLFGGGENWSTVNKINVSNFEKYLNAGDISVILGIGPSYGSWSKESENLKSDKGYGKDVDDRVKKLSFQPISSIPFFVVGYSF